MKTIIAGGRDFKPSPGDFDLVKKLIDDYGITEIISGRAKGADLFGEYCSEKILGKKATMFPADWDSYGKRAGHLRNEKMAQYADSVILFPGGSGTDNMRKLSYQYFLKILYDGENCV